MSLLEQQNFLAKLYTDETFRQNFIAEPVKFGKENDLSKVEIEEILEILPDEVEAFANSLFHKRLREVERFLPVLRSEIGDDFEKLFREFARNFSPKTVNKHLVDAIEFSKFLQMRDLKPMWLKDIAKFVQAKLEFGGLGKSLIIKKFDFDLRKISRSKSKIKLEIEKRKTVGVWMKIGKFHKHFVF